MEIFLKAMVKFFVAIGCIALLALLMAYPTKWVVNYLIAPGALMALFGVPAVTFWKALAINYITAALFKGSASSTKVS